MVPKFISKEYDSINKNFILTYEYRNYRYEVIDFGWNGGMPLSWQHKNEQAHIDHMLDDQPKHDPNFKPEDAQIGFDMFWEYVNQE